MNTGKYNGLIYFLAFSCGFSIMGIELLAGRILAPYFGSSVHVWGSIITVFMLALSLGYLIGGKLSLVSPSLTKFSAIFIFSGLTLFPLAYFATPLLELVFNVIDDSRYGSLAASMGLFFIPTIILGMISPYSVRLLVSHQEESGQVAGVLYFVSTLGSALGTLATSFYLVMWFNVDSIILSFCATLIILGCLALFMANLFKTESLQHA